MPVAVAETTMLWASIILPITPPVLLAVQIRSGSRPSCSAVTRWRLPNMALLEVSEPVRATPSQPNSGAKKA
jgi:hypothetical protein